MFAIWRYRSGVASLENEHLLMTKHTKHAYILMVIKVPCFSAAHILALSNAKTSLQELCISDYHMESRDDIMSDASMTSVATLT